MTEFGDELSSLPIDENEDTYNENIFSQAFGVDMKTSQDQIETGKGISKFRILGKMITAIVVALLLVRSPQVDSMVYRKISSGGITKIGVKVLSFIIVVLLFYFI